MLYIILNTMKHFSGCHENKNFKRNFDVIIVNFKHKSVLYIECMIVCLIHDNILNNGIISNSINLSLVIDTKIALFAKHDI